MFVYTNSLEGKDDEFNRWYDEIHVPEILKFTKSTAAQRFRLSDAQPEDLPGDPEPFRYLAIYEFEIDSIAAFESLTASTEKMDLGNSLDETNAKLVFYDELGERVSSSTGSGTS